MSMDVIVWAASCALAVPSVLPETASWKNYGGTDWAYEQSDWQLIVETFSEEDAPSEVSEKMKNANSGYSITLEPIGAPPEGYAFLEQVVGLISTECKFGAIESPAGIAWFGSEI